MKMYGKGRMLATNGLILCLFYISQFRESSAELETLIVEELCEHNSSVKLDLQFYTSAILKSELNMDLDCEIILDTFRNNSVVISFRKHNIEPNETLTFRDYEGTQLSVTDFRIFWDEERSFVFSGPVTIHFISKNEPLFNKTVKFQLLFTELHDIPCDLTEFECSNKMCVKNEYVCDNHNQCGDLSDETNCNRLCLPKEFKCNNSKCIPGYKVCHSYNYCGDMSDSVDCFRTCSTEEFKCSNGKCIQSGYVCNGDNDCGDRSDEEGCGRVCKPYEFRCFNGKCIPDDQVCDYQNDCGDGSDELLCVHSCRSDEFQCDNQKCISGYDVCNGETNCGDNSDEEDCYRLCHRDEFQCLNKKCLSKHKVCDGNNDCGDRTDEYDCHRPCRENEFRCDNTKCISKYEVCDGNNDCGDRSDEDNCHRTCFSNEFQCLNSKCIPRFLVCNKKNDCGDMSDESKCGIKDKVIEPKMESNLNNPWLISVFVCGGVFVIIIAIYAAVLVKGCVNRKKKMNRNEHLPAAATTHEPPVAPPNFFGRIRQSFRSVRPSAPAVPQTISRPPPEAYEVPSLYPELPPPYSGVDNTGFTADE